MLIKLILTSLLMAGVPYSKVCAQSATDYYCTSFSRCKNKIVISVKLNAIDTRLALDTGASSTILLLETAKRLNVKMTPFPESGLPEAQRCTIADAHIGSLELNDINAVAAKIPSLEQWNHNYPEQYIDGVIGLDTLQKLAIGIDAPGNRVAFWKNGKVDVNQVDAFLMPEAVKTAASRLAPSTTIAVRKSTSPIVSTVTLNRAEKASLFSLTVRIDGIKLEMYIDTGTDIVTLPHTIASRFTSIVPADISKMNMLQATRSMKLMYLRSIEIGAVKVAYPQVADLFNSADPTDALVGMSMFENCRLVLDFPMKKLYLLAVPSQDEENRTLLPGLGIFATTLATDKVIVKIAKGSAAFKSGMKDGDEITNIEGLEEVSVMPRTAEDVHMHTYGKTISITVQRRSVASPLVFVLKVQSQK